jgi:hypothetical protein
MGGTWALALAMTACVGDGDDATADAGALAADATVPTDANTATDAHALADVSPAASPPPEHPCERLHATYAGGGCDGICSSVDFECDFSRSLVACHPEFGCLTGVDIEAACALSLQEAVDCAGEYTPCETDSDCGFSIIPGAPPSSPYCVRVSGASRGACGSGRDGEACAEGADCVGRTCAGVTADALGTCRTVAEGTACETDSDCGDGRCAEIPANVSRPAQMNCTFAPRPTVSWSGNQITIDLAPVPPTGYTAYLGIAVPRVPEPPRSDALTEFDWEELCFVPDLGGNGVDLAPIRQGERCIDLQGRTSVTLTSVNEAVGGAGRSALIRGETTMLIPEFTDGQRGPVSDDAVFQVVHLSADEQRPAWCWAFGNCAPNQPACGPDHYVGGWYGCTTIYGTFTP